MRLFCFGFGYTADALAHLLSGRTLSLAGTRTSLAGPEPLLKPRLAAFQGDVASEEVRALLAGTTHMLVSIPPDLEGDVVLRLFGRELAALPELAWIGYLSTVGVYGDWQGAWVDETFPTRPSSERSLRRVQAEQAWLAFAAETGRRVQVFRLAGIYGPQRSVLDGLRAGTARRIVKPGQVFNRIHVDDIARAVAAAIDAPAAQAIYNLGDDEPAPPQDVVAFAAELLGVAVPPEIDIDRAGLEGMAASFWSECKRVSNQRLKSDLGVALIYPTYREGLTALAAAT